MICDKCISPHRKMCCEQPEENDHCPDFIGQPVISDSGHRTEFATGAVRDMHAGKGRMDLLPWAAIMEISIHCERGADKYGERNIDKGVPMHSLLDSALRHLAKYMEGAKDEPHLVAAVWNLLWAVQFEKVKPEMQDIEAQKDVK